MDPIANITLGASTIGIVSPISGSINIDTTTGALASAALFLNTGGIQVPLVDLGLTTNPTTGVTTLTGNTLANGLGTGVNVSFTGFTPSTVTTTVSALGAPVVSNTLAVSTALVCFASGTLIRTARGDQAIEDLAIGDLVVTASGAHRPIRWLGHRSVNCRQHPRPHEAMPVRVVAHAFGENRPARDLFVSPGHSLCVDVVGEVLIPAGVLINGTTVTQEDVDSVTYWHVELDGHDILLAENMPAESYLEMDNRNFFAESGVVALDASPDAPVVTHADFCRPFHAEGALVEAVRAQLAARAQQLGWQLEEQGLGDLYLLVDGVRIEPRVRGLSARFAVPANAEKVWLVSGTSVPAEIYASRDSRSLGLRIASVTIDDGFEAPRVIAADDPRLCVGFHDVEQEGDRAMRWTAGRARLPAGLWEGLEDVFLRIDFGGPALPRWIAPAAAASEMAPLLLTA